MAISSSKSQARTATAANRERLVNAALQDPTAADPKFLALQKLLTNKRLVGLFTITGKPMKDLTEETYEIKKIEKLALDDDLWAIETRIKYGDHDVTVPIAITILWANDTPIMTLDKVVVPGLGTFSARVVFHEEKYAGTWSHDAVGGHLFGRIESIPTK